MKTLKVIYQLFSHAFFTVQCMQIQKQFIFFQLTKKCSFVCKFLSCHGSFILSCSNFVCLQSSSIVTSYIFENFLNKMGQCYGEQLHTDIINADLVYLCTIQYIKLTRQTFSPVLIAAQGSRVNFKYYELLLDRTFFFSFPR